MIPMLMAWSLSVHCSQLHWWHEDEGAWMCGPQGCSLRDRVWGDAHTRLPPSDFSLIQGSQHPGATSSPALHHTDRPVHDSQWNYMSHAAGKHTLTKDQQSHWLFIRCFSQAINGERQLQGNRSPWSEPVIESITGAEMNIDSWHRSTGRNVRNEGSPLTRQPCPPVTWDCQQQWE